MLILSIETSADETGVSIVETSGEFPTAKYKLRGNALRSQIEHHREFGGILPNLAKREHAGALVPLLEKAMLDVKLPLQPTNSLSLEETSALETLLGREPGLADAVLEFHRRHGVPPVNLIAVTNGPGLEPALWVGVNFAKTLAQLWNVSVVPVNHMEGHVLASVFDGQKLAPLQFPALALLISGGHTEFDLMHDWLHYKKIGQTRDDAVGEAYDKVARLLGLPYPGGPEISRLAAEGRERNLSMTELFNKSLPRPMLGSGDLDFSFSGLKTAVRYAVQDRELNEDDKRAVAREFDDAVIEVLTKKTLAAIEQYQIQSVIIGGGVSANRYLCDQIRNAVSEQFPDTQVYTPGQGLSTDNSVMIALAGHARTQEALPSNTLADLKADGNRPLA